MGLSVGIWHHLVVELWRINTDNTYQLTRSPHFSSFLSLAYSTLLNYTLLREHTSTHLSILIEHQTVVGTARLLWVHARRQLRNRDRERRFLICAKGFHYLIEWIFDLSRVKVLRKSGLPSPADSNGEFSPVAANSAFDQSPRLLNPIGG